MKAAKTKQRWYWLWYLGLYALVICIPKPKTTCGISCSFILSSDQIWNQANLQYNRQQICHQFSFFPGTSLFQLDFEPIAYNRAENRLGRGFLFCFPACWKALGFLSTAAYPRLQTVGFAIRMLPAVKGSKQFCRDLLRVMDFLKLYNLFPAQVF